MISSVDNRRANRLILFLLGLFSETKIFFFGCLAISEIAIFALAPLMFLKDYRVLKHDGFLVFTNMLFGLMAAMFASSINNHTAFPFVVKSFAVMYAVFAYFIVFHRLLRSRYDDVGWFFVGVFLSSIITVFAFNPRADVSEGGFVFIANANADTVLEETLAWTTRVRHLTNIFTCGFYFATPLAISVFTPILYVIVAVSTTVSGRAGSITVLMGGVLMLCGRKSRRAMRAIGRHLFVAMIVGACFLVAMKFAYQHLASTGALGEEARTKYESQTRKGNSIMALLMAGRSEFFAGLRAALDRPIMGFGPQAEDTGGYGMRFVMKYGDETDIRRMANAEFIAARSGNWVVIPTHSHIVGGWVHYGLFGMIFYVWILYLFFSHFKRYAACIPQLHGLFSSLIPLYLWHIFFSPFGSRWMFALLMACIFFARAIGNGKMRLPYAMEMEAEKYD